MSALVWPSPRSSASPSPGLSHHHHHPGMPRHQVSFGHNAAHHGGDGNGFSGTTGGNGGFGFGFGAPAASTSSSTSGFGFGSSAFGSSSNNTAGFKSPTSTTGLPMLMSSPSVAGTGTSTSNNRRRRRRSDSPEEMREQLNEDNEDNGNGETAFHGKRVRREVRPIKSMGNLLGGQAQGTNSGQGGTGSEVDVGKALAGLSKPALLTVLTSLLTQQPALKPLVLSLLPAPSLETFASTLSVLERRVTDSLPVGTNLRDEYIWSRIRAPLEEYIAEARLALGQFCPSPSLTGNSNEEPTIIFSFLYTLTLSVRKLEALLPRAPVPFSSASSTSNASQASINNPSTLNPRDPLISFLPPLFNQWHHLITRLSTLVNQNGRVLGAEMVRGWFRNLDSLVTLDGMVGFAQQHQQQQGFGQSAFGNAYQATGSSDMTSVGRRASEAIRERFVKEVGWLIGIRTAVPSMTPAVNMHQQMQHHAVVPSLGGGDSRMMMMDDGENSDEEL